MNKRIYIIFGCVVAFGIIMALIAALLKTDAPTSTTTPGTNSIAPVIPIAQAKTFTNDLYGFSFKYPGNWYLYGVPLNTSDDTLLYNIGISNVAYSKTLTTEDFVPVQAEVFDADPGTLGISSPVAESVTVNGTRVLKFTYIDDLDDTQKSFVVMKIKGEHFLVLKDNDPLTYKDVFQAILDSIDY